MNVKKILVVLLIHCSMVYANPEQVPFKNRIFPGDITFPFPVHLDNCTVQGNLTIGIPADQTTQQVRANLTTSGQVRVEGSTTVVGLLQRKNGTFSTANTLTVHNLDVHDAQITYTNLYMKGAPLQQPSWWPYIIGGVTVGAIVVVGVICRKNKIL